MRRSKRPIFFVLALALWLASTLGLVHGTLHAPELLGVASTAETDVTCAFDSADASEGARCGASSDTSHELHASHGLHGWLSKLFGHHSGDQCRLYEQLAASCAPLGVPVVAILLALPQSTPAYFLGAAPARSAAVFDARGPPSTL